MENKITQAERLRVDMWAMMYDVVWLLDWDIMLYSQFKYECGRLFLEAYLKGDKESIEIMERSAAYWGWWKLHWYLREQEWLARPYVHPGSPLNMLRSGYNMLHNVRCLAECEELDESYGRDLVKELR